MIDGQLMEQYAFEANAPKQSFQWPNLLVHCDVDVVEICKVGVDFCGPVRLGQDDSSNVAQREPTAHERPILKPCYHVMQGPGNNQADRCRGQIPPI